MYIYIYIYVYNNYNFYYMWVIKKLKNKLDRINDWALPSLAFGITCGCLVLIILSVGDELKQLYSVMFLKDGSQPYIDSLNAKSVCLCTLFNITLPKDQFLENFNNKHEYVSHGYGPYNLFKKEDCIELFPPLLKDFPTRDWAYNELIKTRSKVFREELFCRPVKNYNYNNL